MMLRIWISAIVIGLLVSASSALADHSPTAWTRGHYTGSELTADAVVAYWAFEEPEKDGLAPAEDGSRRGNVLVQPPTAAASVGDAMCDPVKDTSGPSLNILIKVMSVVARVIAPRIV